MACLATTAAVVTTLATGSSPAEHAILGWHLHLNDLGLDATILPFVTRTGMPLATADFDAEIDAFLARARRTLAGTDTLLLVTADHGHMQTHTRIDLSEIPGFYDTLASLPSGDSRMAQCFVRPARVKEFLRLTRAAPLLGACVGGGSNAMGLFSGFLADPCEIHGVEPLGKGTKVGEHAATMTYGKEGVMHGFNSYMLQNEKGEPDPVYSIASGLDYPSVGPEHAFLKDTGRVQYFTATDRQAVEAFFMLSRVEGIIPALESCHAVAHAIRLSRENPKHARSILVNLSGRGDKDMDYVIEHFGFGKDFHL